MTNSRLTRLLPQTLYEPRERGEPTPIFRAGCRATWGLINLVGGLKIIGVNNLPLEGPAIMASTHRAEMESPILGAAIHRLIGRQVEFLGNRGLWHTWDADGNVVGKKWHGDIFELFGSFPLVSAGNRDGVTSRYIDKILERGGLVGIYPKKSLSSDLARLRKGMAWFAIRHQVTVVPLAFSGVGYGHYGPLVMNCLPPMPPPVLEQPKNTHDGRHHLMKIANEFLEDLTPVFKQTLTEANAHSAALPRTIRTDLFSIVATHVFDEPPHSYPEATRQAP